MINMGLGKLGSLDLCMKRKFRWVFNIIDSYDGPRLIEDGMDALPPEKSARPSLSFKEIDVQGLNETIYFPGKPDWKPINLTLYDVKTNTNPVISWLNNKYNIKTGNWSNNLSFKKTALLSLLDGCGTPIETWIYENVWPNNIEWGELDYSDSQYVIVDLTLRYDRAYVEE